MFLDKLNGFENFCCDIDFCGGSQPSRKEPGSLAGKFMTAMHDRFAAEYLAVMRTMTFRRYLESFGWAGVDSEREESWLAARRVGTAEGPKYEIRTTNEVSYLSALAFGSRVKDPDTYVLGGLFSKQEVFDRFAAFEADQSGIISHDGDHTLHYYGRYLPKPEPVVRKPAVQTIADPGIA